MLIATFCVDFFYSLYYYHHLVNAFITMPGYLICYDRQLYCDFCYYSLFPTLIATCKD